MENNNSKNYYVNSVRIHIGQYDVVLEMFNTTPTSDSPDKDAEVENRATRLFGATMSPMHFKKFVQIANQQLQKIEEIHGELKVDFKLSDFENEEQE